MSNCHSLNHVRLPIGYWAFDVSGGEPFHQGQIAYLNNAVTWARNHGLKLIVDLRARHHILFDKAIEMIIYRWSAWKPEWI